MVAGTLNRGLWTMRSGVVREVAGGDFDEPLAEEGFLVGGEAVAQVGVEAAGALPALGEQRLALVGELHRLDAAVVRADRAAQAAIPLEVGDDQADRLRGEHGQAGDLGPGDARVGVDHGRDQELGMGHAEVLERAVDAEADGIAGLAEQVAKVALFAALALPCFGTLGRYLAPLHHTEYYTRGRISEH